MLLTRRQTIVALVLFQITIAINIVLSAHLVQDEPQTAPIDPVVVETQEEINGQCEIFRDIGKNDLSINDIVVKSANSNTICIRARFSLAIKVEESIQSLQKPISNVDNDQHQEPTLSNGEHKEGEEEVHDDQRVILGYLPLDTVLTVEDSCPDPIKTDTQELEMIVTFGCGKLAFTFNKTTEHYYLSSIKGVVSLDSTVVREFLAEKPMFFTSDLSKHFKYNDLIEVTSEAKTRAFILTANFYHSEFETYRNTTSRDFIRPPDEDSKPFKEQEATQ